MHKKMDKLLTIIDNAINAWAFFPECEYGSNEAIIPTFFMIELEKAYTDLVQSEHNKLADMSPSARAMAFVAFSETMITFIDTYAVPQYGDAPDDLVENWSAEQCLNQVEKYIKRRNTSRRPDEKKLDILKAVHYLQLAAEKMEAA